MSSLVIGIDPGLTGALALIDCNGLCALVDMPVMAKGSGGGVVKNEINPAALSALLRGWVNGRGDEVVVVMEQVGVMPKQGGASNFSLGDTVGCLRTAVACNGYALQWVTPGQWKKRYGLSLPPAAVPISHRRKEAMKISDLAKQKEKLKEIDRENAGRKKEAKELARARAIQLYPTADLGKKKDHNRAEAILIGRYGWEFMR